MSIDNCARCGFHVDTDEDPEFYDEEILDLLGYRDEGLCELCREWGLKDFYSHKEVA